MMYFQTRRIIILLSFLYIGFIFTGCSTSPDFTENNYPGILASNGRVLFHFNLAKDNLMLNHFLSSYTDNDISAIINRTNRLSVSIDGFGKDSEFDIIAEGDFPRFFTNVAIGREENWIKHKGIYTFWENETDGLFASVPVSSVAVISNSDISPDLKHIESGQRNYIPDNIKAEFDQSAITIYSHQPGAGIYKSLKIPAGKMLIQDLFFVIRKDADMYYIFGELDFLNDMDAKVFSTALKFGLLMTLKATGKNSIMKIVHEGRIDAVQNRIIVDNIFLNSVEMIDLLSGKEAHIQGN
jgi:hypothetical protein